VDNDERHQEKPRNALQAIVKEDGNGATCHIETLDRQTRSDSAALPTPRPIRRSTWGTTTKTASAASRYFSGSAGLQRVTFESLETLHVPLPPVQIQRQLLAEVAAQRKRIAAMNEEAQRKTEQAKAEFEAMILGEKKVRA